MDHFGHISHAAQTDIGLKRKNNEDAFGVFPSVGVFCVADGMGGGDDGEVASAAVVRAVEMFAEGHPLPDGAAYPIEGMLSGLTTFVSRASKWLFERTEARNLKGCGSTFVGVCFDAAQPAEAKALHAGDSRLYRIRGKSIRQITKDHSAAEIIGAKDDNEVNPMFRGMVLRAVGTQPSVDLEITPFDVREGDFVLICSDGLYRMVTEKRIASIVRAAKSLDESVSTLVAAAKESGGIDNITAVLIGVGKLPPPLSTVAMPPLQDDSDISVAIQEDEDTRDTSSRSAATFYVESATQATNATTPDENSVSTDSAMMIPEESDASESTDDDPKCQKSKGQSSFRTFLLNLLGRWKRRPFHAVMTFAVTGAVVGAVAGLVRAYSVSRTADRARNQVVFEEALNESQRRDGGKESTRATSDTELAKSRIDAVDRLAEACRQEGFAAFMEQWCKAGGKDDLFSAIKKSMDDVLDDASRTDITKRLDSANALTRGQIRDAMSLLSNDVAKHIADENRKLDDQSLTPDERRKASMRLDELQRFAEVHKKFEDNLEDEKSYLEAINCCAELMRIVAGRMSGVLGL